MCWFNSGHTRTMTQSTKNELLLVKLGCSEYSLKTGDMGGCVSVVGMCNPQAGIYQNVCGQHGSGGIRAINFERLMKEGNIHDSFTTKFIVVFSIQSNDVYTVLRDLRDMLNGECSYIRNSEFEFYNAANAEVNRKGEVIHNFFGRLRMMYRFIAKFCPYVDSEAYNSPRDISNEQYTVTREILKAIQ